MLTTLPGRIKLHMRDQLIRMKPLMHCLIDLVIHLLLIMEPKLHLRRMHIDVHILTVDLHVQYHKRILVLHGEVLIRILDRL